MHDEKVVGKEVRNVDWPDLLLNPSECTIHAVQLGDRCMHQCKIAIILTLGLTFLFGGSVNAQVDVTSKGTLFEGPYSAEVVRVIDGDTIDVNVALWPGLRAEYSVRVRGIDAPEIFRPDCEREKELGEAAKARAEKLYPPGLAIEVRDVSYDAFSGRVVAEISRFRSDRMLPFAKDMLDRELVVEWQPSQSAFTWCLEAE